MGIITAFVNQLELSNQNILSKLKHYLETIRTSDHTL